MSYKYKERGPNDRGRLPEGCGCDVCATYRGGLWRCICGGWNDGLCCEHCGEQRSKTVHATDGDKIAAALLAVAAAMRGAPRIVGGG